MLIDLEKKSWKLFSCSTAFQNKIFESFELETSLFNPSKFLIVGISLENPDLFLYQPYFAKFAPSIFSKESSIINHQ